MNAAHRITLAGAVVLLATLAAAAAVALALLGVEASHLRAIAFAGAVAGGGAVAGWIVARQGRGGPAGLAVAGGLAATLVRMVPLLVALAWLVGRDQPSWEGLAAGLLVVFHGVLLLTDIGLNALVDRRSEQAAEPPEVAENSRSAGADVAN